MQNNEQAIQEKKKFYGARYDIAFKSIFQSDYDLLGYLISGILKEKVIVKECKATEPEANSIDERRKVLDIVAEADGKIINIEVDTENRGKYIQRRDYAFISALYANEVKRGQSPAKMNDVYQIILDFRKSKNSKNINRFRVRSDFDDEIMVDNIIFYIIRVENLIEKGYNNLSKFEKFLAAIGENNEEKLEELSKTDRRIKNMTKKLKKLNDDNKIIELMSAEEENKQYMESVIEENQAKGKAEGIAQGKAEGIKEKAIETAKKMLEKNFDQTTISDLTGLSIKEIKNLQ